MGKCPADGCIKKVDSNWRVISNKTGNLWPAKYNTKSDAENALKAYHSNFGKRGSKMDSNKIASGLVTLAKEILEAAKSGTFPCPECGTKVLENTKYCLKCKKKVEPAS